MPINVKVLDERDQKDLPPISPEQFQVKPVLEFADIVVAEDEELTIEVVLRNGQQQGGLRTPTAVLEHGHKEELYELELVDAVTGVEYKIWQKRQVPDVNAWTINVLILPKPELHYKSMRAISRAVSREIFTISAIRSYGEMIPAMYSDVTEYTTAQTKFADAAPWVLGGEK